MKWEGKKLWVWWSVECLERYANGKVIVMANRKPAAIETACEAYRKHVTEVCSWYESEEIDNAVSAFRVELETKEPEMYDGYKAILIEGSE